MVVRSVRRVDRADPVDQDLDTLSGKPPQDRARRPRREARGRNTGKTGKNFTELSVHIALEIGRFDHACACQQIELAQALGADDDLPLIVDPAIVQVFGRRFIGFRKCGILAFLRSYRSGGKHGRECECGGEKAAGGFFTIQHILANKRTPE